MYFTLADGKKMFYDQAGAGATAFVCIHGGGGDHRHVLPQFEFLSKKSCAINVDLRGYGASDSLTKYGTISEYAEDIAQLLGHLNIKRAIIVGHSLGGMVAVEFAARFTKLTTAIIMISSGIVFPKDAFDDGNDFLQRLAGPDFDSVLLELVQQLLPYGDKNKLIEQTFCAVSQQQWIAHFTAMLLWDKKAPELLSKISVPMLYIGDNGGEYSDLDRVKNICPQLMIGQTVGSGHFPTIEVPGQVNAMIEQFCRINKLLP